MVFVQPPLLYSPELNREFALCNMLPTNLVLLLRELLQISLTHSTVFRELVLPLALNVGFDCL